MKCLILSALTAICVASCDAPPKDYTPPFDTSQYKGPQKGVQNQLLILGSPHLSQLPDSFEIESLTPVMDRLTAWQPEMIAIEAVSGLDCEFMRSYPIRYAKSVEYYCWDPAPARDATGLSVTQAHAKAQSMLDGWPENPSAANRRNLAALFLASGDRASALVQWLRLPENERRAGDGLDDVLVEYLNILRVKPNENYQIAAVLAARLGHERVYPIDDHTADIPSKDPDAYGAAIEKAWKNPATDKRMEAYDILNNDLATSEGLLAMYQAFNSSNQAPLIYQSDFGAALEEPSKQGFGRNYVGYWETRNLRMSANIRHVIGQNPGRKTLVIVGASHKAYLESYLHQMHDIRVVDAETILK